jgi:hypothetical protein
MLGSQGQSWCLFERIVNRITEGDYSEVSGDSLVIQQVPQTNLIWLIALREQNNFIQYVRNPANIPIDHLRHHIGNLQHLLQQILRIVITNPNTPRQTLRFDRLHLLPYLPDPTSIHRRSREMNEVQVEVFDL